MPVENSPIIALLVVALACASFTNAYPGGSSSPVTRVFYRESQAYLKTSGYVNHIEADLYINGSLLFADGHSLKSTNGVTTELVVGHPTRYSYVEGTAGSARFNSIFDFWQVNSTHVLLVDIGNHCIRVVNRVSKSTSTFAGRCRSAGNTNSRGSSARFYFPSSILANKNDNRSVIIAQGSGTSNVYLSSINLDTRYVTTLLTSGLESPSGMAWSENGDSLYVTNNHYIAEVNWSTKAVTRLAGSTSAGSQNGQFSQARFYHPKEMVVLDGNVIVLADFSNNQLKFLNTDEKVVSPICDTYNNCALPGNPRSIAHINGDFYIGSHRQIIKLSDISCGSPSTGMNAVRTVHGQFNNDTTTYECETGYELIGNRTIYCEAFGRWIILPECRDTATSVGPNTSRQPQDNSYGTLKLFPAYGPISGGTLVNLSSDVSLNNVKSISFLHSPLNYTYKAKFNISDKGLPISFLTPPFNHTNITVDLTVEFDTNGSKQLKTFSFTYKPNPTLTNIEPRISILSGGTTITVSGTHMDSVAKPKMIVYLKKVEQIVKEYLLPCKHVPASSRQILCRTPDLKDKPLNLTSPSGSSFTKVDDFKETGIVFTLGFILAGLSDYKDLSKHEDKNLRDLGILELRDDPVINSFKDNGLEEVLQIDPRKENIIRIRGDNLMFGGSTVDYRVVIGKDGTCQLRKLSTNLLTCKPPKTIPEADEDNYMVFRGSKAPHILVAVGNVRKAIGYLYYPTNPWVDNEWIKITVYCLSAVISLLIIVILLYKKFSGSRTGRSQEIHSEDHLELCVQHSKLEEKNEAVVTPFLGQRLDLDLQAKLDQCRIPLEKIKVGAAIGAGQFGTVHKGQFVTESGNLQEVAIKATKDEKEMNFDDFCNFLSEAMTMMEFKHENVLSLIGVVSEKGERPLIILPYMERGDLHKLARDDQQEFVLGDIVQFGYQIANGMSYLSEQKFVHRDLAARNCMVDINFVIKIADYGLCREVYERDYYQMEGWLKPLPLRWMAIESIKLGRYTTKSDVWSFGVTIWELLTSGQMPYPDVGNTQLKSFLYGGGRLDWPITCPPVIADVLSRCWNKDPKKRPTFSELSRFLAQLLENSKKPPVTSARCADGEYYSYARNLTNRITENFTESSTASNCKDADGYYLDPLSASSE